MFTDQYYAYKKMMFTGYEYSTYFTGPDGASITVDAKKGWSADIGASMNKPQCGTPARQYPGVYFGTGTTAPQKSDIALESYITTGLSFTSSSVLFADKGNGKYEYSASYIIRNTSAENITITEVGFHGGFSAVGSGSVTYYMPILFERTVLETPITIAAGESKTVTYKVTINQPA